jgi:hypothetical protein
LIKSFLIAALAIVGMMIAWTVVQTMWRKIFTGNAVGEDVLADRRSCSDCSCITICKNKNIKIKI